MSEQGSIVSSVSDNRSALEQSFTQSLSQPNRAFFVPRTPRAAARAGIDLPNPLFGQPVVPSASVNRPVFCQCDRRAGERCAFCWAWEPSETQSIPTLWSGATSIQTSGLSMALSGTLWPVGQRVLWLNPERVSSGNRSFIISLKREVAQELWGGLEVCLCSKTSLKVETVKPDGVKKGKKIVCKIPEDFPIGDYDVSVVFGSMCIPGVLALEVTTYEQRPDTGSSEMD